MKIQYVIKIAFYLAQYPPSETVPTSRLSRLLDISIESLYKLLRELNNNDVIGIERGRGGGVFLLPEATLGGLMRVCRLHYRETKNNDVIHEIEKKIAEALSVMEKSLDRHNIRDIYLEKGKSNVKST